VSARTGIPVDEGGGVSKIQEVISGTKRAIGLLLPVGKAVH